MNGLPRDAELASDRRERRALRKRPRDLPALTRIELAAQGGDLAQGRDGARRVDSVSGQLGDAMSGAHGHLRFPPG